MDERELRTLKAELTRQQQEVKARIVRAVSHHYEGYQRVVRSLDATVPFLDEVRAPLAELGKSVERLASDAASKRDAYAYKLAHLEHIRHQKKLLSFFLDTHRKLEWLEHHVGIASQDAPLDSDKLHVADPAELERLALLHALLRASLETSLPVNGNSTAFTPSPPGASTATDFPFLANLAPRLDAVRTVLQRSAHRHLDAVMKTAAAAREGELTLPPLPSAEAVTRAFLHLDAWSPLVVALITDTIDPVLLAARSSATATSSDSKTRTNLPMYLTTVAAGLRAGPLALVRRVASAAPSAQARILAHHVVVRCVEALDTSIGSTAFSAAVPAAFHRNYSAAATFFADLMRDVGLINVSTTAGDDIPRELADLMRRWPVETYFTLVARAVTAEVERAPDSGERVLSALDRMAADYLPALQHRFFKLAAQMLMRHHAALSAIGTSLEHTSQSDRVADGAAMPATDAVAHMVALARTHAAVRASRLLAADGVAPVLRPYLEPILTAGRAPLVAQWQAAAARDLAASACSVLRQSTRSLAAQFRATGRPVPTAAGAYVAEVFRPVHDLVEQYQQQHEQQEQQEQAVCDVDWTAIVPVVARAALDDHRATVEELLVTLRRTEESLKRLKKRGGSSNPTEISGSTGSSSGTAVSDEDKIRVQVVLDARALRDQVALLPFVVQAAEQPAVKQAVDAWMTPTWDVLRAYGANVDGE